MREPGAGGGWQGPVSSSLIAKEPSQGQALRADRYDEPVHGQADDHQRHHNPLGAYHADRSVVSGTRNSTWRTKM